MAAHTGVEADVPVKPLNDFPSTLTQYALTPPASALTSGKARPDAFHRRASGSEPAGEPRYADTAFSWYAGRAKGVGAGESVRRQLRGGAPSQHAAVDATRYKVVPGAG